ncbi:MAG: YitT family protein [Oscillospiraceae bacterium]
MSKTTAPRTGRLNRFLMRLVKITLGAALYAAGVSVFLEPNSVISGGVTGISMMLARFLPIGVGTLVFTLNIPLMLAGWRKLGRRFFTDTLIAIAIASVFINLFTRITPPTNDILLGSLAGGALIAVGIGIIFRAGATTGGSDIVVRLIKLKYKHIKSGRIFLILDGIIVLSSGIVFGGWDYALYGSLALVVDTTVLDIVLYGRDEAKLVLIVSRKEDAIMEQLLKKLDIGASFLNGTGGFTGRDERVILCAMKKNVLPKAREVVKNTDPEAFMIVTSATEIFGKGFKGYQSEIF